MERTGIFRKAVLAGALVILALSWQHCRAQEYAAPSRDEWVMLVNALAGVSMPLAAHNQVQGILRTIEATAAKREQDAKAQAPAAPPAEPK